MIKKDTITAVFRAGVNVGDDPKTVQQELLKCENGYFDRMGAITKRNGQEETYSSSLDQSILAEHEGNLIALGDGKLKTLWASSYPTVSEAMKFTSVSMETKRTEKGNMFLYPTIYEGTYLTVLAYTNYKAEDNKYYPTVVTYVKNQGYQSDIQELETGSSSNPVFVRLVYDGSYVYAIYAKSTNYLAYHRISLGTGSITNTSTNIGSADVSATRAYDAIRFGASDDAILIAYPDTSGDIKVKVMKSGSVTSSTTLAATTVSNVGLWKYASDSGMILYFDSDAGVRALRQIGYDESLNITVTDHIVDNSSYAIAYPTNMTGVRCQTDSKLFVTSYLSSTPAWTKLMRYTHDHSAATSTYEKTFGINGIITSRPFLTENYDVGLVVNFRTWASAGSSPQQSTYVVIDENGDPRGKFLVDRGGPNELPTAQDTAILGNVLVDGDDFTLAALVRTSADKNPWSFPTGAGEVLYNDIGISRVVLSKANPSIKGVKQNNLTIIPNSLPYVYDGQTLTEFGFITYPEGLVGTEDGSGYSMPAGTYGYKATYEWTDAKGNLHSSAASPSESVTVTSGKRAKVIVPCLGVTLKENVKIVLYRTVASGSIYYRHKVMDNDATTYGVNFYDDSADSALEGKPILYTTGNIVDNIQPHPCKYHCIHQDRYFHVSCEYPETRIYYSKHILPNEGIPTTDVFHLEVPADGGDITGIETYLGNLLVFKNQRIFAFSGEGYTDDNQGTQYSKPFEVSRNIGCVNHKSIAKIDRGVLFKSTREICLLTQTMQIDRVGERARYYTDNTTIKSAVVDNAKGYVIFFTTGDAIVYSYVFNQWSTFTNRVASDAINIDDSIYWYDSGTSKIMKENTSYLDVSSSIVMTIETGWISLAKLGGVQRVDRIWPIGQNISGHTLKVQTAVDLIPYWDAAQEFNATAFGSAHSYTAHYTGLASSYEDKAYLLEVRMRRPKCHSIRFRIFDAETAGAAINEGYSLTGLGLRVGKRRGPLQVGASREV